MNAKDSKETRSFRDPMTPRMEAAQKRREAFEAEFPRVEEVYDGFYVHLETLSEEGVRYLLGAQGIIGSELLFDSKRGLLLAEDAGCVAQLPQEALERLARYAPEVFANTSSGNYGESSPSSSGGLLGNLLDVASDGASGNAEAAPTSSLVNWNIKALVSATFFRAQDKCAGAEIAFMCWAPMSDEHEAALCTFTHNISERLASGDRANLELAQEQFISVLRSGGEWFLTGTTKRAPLEKGTIVYKSRRSGTERLTSYALKHRVGCNVVAIFFWIALIVGIVALVWVLFFS